MCPRKMHERCGVNWRGALVTGLLLLGILQLGNAAMIKAKAWLAPVLITRAWEQSLGQGGIPVKPWPWADTWPVALLRIPSMDIELPVLAGDSGHALAFAPGHVSASAQPGSAGQAVIGGHRDTHFAFLQDLAPDTRLQLQLPDGELRRYRTGPGTVVDASKSSLLPATGNESLLLVTCYPFETLQPGGPLRYVVSAVPELIQLPVRREQERLSI